MSEIKLDNTCMQDVGILLCPLCKDNYLHQIRIEIGWRCQEDGDVTYVDSNLSATEIKTITAKNISSPLGYGYRRQFLVIYFECEGCQEISRLHIYQHKGNTMVHWIDEA